MVTNYRIVKQGDEWFEVQSWRDVPGVMNRYNIVGFTDDESTAERAIQAFEDGDMQGAYALLEQYDE